MHKHFLLSALQEANNGRGLCAPNPSVGAVAVQDHQIIAQAWHNGPGSPHAEPLALSQFPANTPNVTLYVTLEPCNHWGRTPPCVDAIIKHGIAKVIYAYRDPNPVVRKISTEKILRDHGIEVVYYPLPEIDEFYQSYEYWTRTNMPWVRVKMAQSLDGKIAGTFGARVALSNDLCAQFTHQQRKCSDIILTTAATINNDDPLFNVRLDNKITSKPVAIVDRCLNLNPQAKVLQTAAHCTIYHDPAYTSGLIKNCDFYPIALVNGMLDLQLIIAQLGARGCHDVWVEAGEKLFTALHLTGLVNQTFIYIVPKILGTKALDGYTNNVVFDRKHSVKWQAMGDNMMMTLNWQNN